MKDELYLLGDKLMFNSQYLGDVVRSEDGYFVFFHNNKKEGFYTSESLDMISKFLKDINADWDKHLNKYFKK